MDVQTLKYFVAVVEEGTISAAAKLLHTSQPALSRQMMVLETDLATTLFTRSNRAITLTDSGHLLYKRAKELITLYARIKPEIQDSKHLAGDLYIGAGESSGIQIIAKVVKRIIAAHPDIHIHFYSGNAEDLAFKMQNGILDFAVVLNTTNNQYAFLQLPAKDTWGVLMKPTDPLARFESITPQMLTSRKLILSSQSDVRNQFELWSGRPLDTDYVIGTYNLIFNAALLVQEGLGLAIGIKQLVASTAESQLIFRPLTNYDSASLNLIWKQDREHSPIAALFLKKLRAQIAKEIGPTR